MRNFINWVRGLGNKKIGNKRRLFKLLEEHEVIVADVGSTGGLNFRWRELLGKLRVYSFDPDQRAVSLQNQSEVVFKTGLWSKKTEMPLFLTKFPPASSIYKPNNKVLNDFLNASCHEIIGEDKIILDDMHSVLKNYSSPDFIKVDAEGADLHILKGAEQFLSTTVFGVQVEVQFIERYIGSPMFSDIDTYLRRHGYFLMDLSRESWIRSSNLWGLNASPQVIWADAVYLLSETELLKRSAELNIGDVKVFLVKIISVAMIYGFYDYAISIVDAFMDNDRISKNAAIELKNLIEKSVQPAYKVLTIKFLLVMMAVSAVIVTFPSPKHRKSAETFFKIAMAGFFKAVYKMFSRVGPSNVAVSDFFPPNGW